MIIGISGKMGSGKDLVGNIINYLTSVHNTSDYNDNVDYSKVETAFKIKKFADSIKDIVCILLGCTREDIEDREFKNKELGEEWWYYGAYQHGSHYEELKSIHADSKDAEYILQYSHMNHIDLIKPTPRLLLQLLGTECGRDIIHPNIWVNALISGYKRQFICNTCHDTQDWLPSWVITDMRFPNELKTVKDRGGITIRVERWNEEDGSTYGWGNPNANHISETALDNAEFNYTINNNGTIEDLVLEVQKILIKEKVVSS
jgi:hypothetical protein